MFYADRFGPVVEVCEETGVRVKYPKLVSKVWTVFNTVVTFRPLSQWFCYTRGKKKAKMLKRMEKTGAQTTYEKGKYAS